MGWFDSVMKIFSYGTLGEGGGTTGGGYFGPSWLDEAKENQWREFIPESQWAGQYGGSFEDWLDLQNRAGKGPPGQSAQPWQVPGTSDWLARQYMHDPLTFQLMQNAGEAASRDYTTMAKGSARRGADVQTRELSNALASRGGGNLGAAMAGGATMRSQAELGGMQTGMGMEQQANDQLLNALSYRFNIANQIVGAKLGQTQAHLGYKAARKGAQDNMWGNIIGGGMSGIGSIFQGAGA